MAEEMATHIATENPQLQHALQRRRLGIGDKSVRTIITPEGAQLTVHIASAGHRILAIALDFVFLFIFFYLIVTAMQMAQAFFISSSEEIGVLSEIIFGFFILLLYMLRILYFLVLEMGSLFGHIWQTHCANTCGRTGWRAFNRRGDCGAQPYPGNRIIFAGGVYADDFRQRKIHRLFRLGDRGLAVAALAFSPV